MQIFLAALGIAYNYTIDGTLDSIKLDKAIADISNDAIMASLRKQALNGETNLQLLSMALSTYQQMNGVPIYIDSKRIIHKADDGSEICGIGLDSTLTNAATGQQLTLNEAIKLGFVSEQLADYIRAQVMGDVDKRISYVLSREGTTLARTQNEYIKIPQDTKEGAKKLIADVDPKSYVTFHLTDDGKPFSYCPFERTPLQLAMHMDPTIKTRINEAIAFLEKNGIKVEGEVNTPDKILEIANALHALAIKTKDRSFFLPKTSEEEKALWSFLVPFMDVKRMQLNQGGYRLPLFGFSDDDNIAYHDGATFSTEKIISISALITDIVGGGVMESSFTIRDGKEVHISINADTPGRILQIAAILKCGAVTNNDLTKGVNVRCYTIAFSANDPLSISIWTEDGLLKDFSSGKQEKVLSQPRDERLVSELRQQIALGKLAMTVNTNRIEGDQQFAEKLKGLEAELKKAEADTLTKYVNGNTPAKMCVFSFDPEQKGNLEINVKFNNGGSSYYIFGKTKTFVFTYSYGKLLTQITADAMGRTTEYYVVREGIIFDTNAWAIGTWKDGRFTQTVAKNMTLQQDSNGNILATYDGAFRSGSAIFDVVAHALSIVGIASFFSADYPKSLNDAYGERIQETITYKNGEFQRLNRVNSYDEGQRAFAKYDGAVLFAIGAWIVHGPGRITWNEAMEEGVKNRDKKMFGVITYGNWVNFMVDVVAILAPGAIATRLAKTLATSTRLAFLVRPLMSTEALAAIAANRGFRVAIARAIIHNRVLARFLGVTTRNFHAVINNLLYAMTFRGLIETGYRIGYRFMLKLHAVGQIISPITSALLGGDAGMQAMRPGILKGIAQMCYQIGQGSPGNTLVRNITTPTGLIFIGVFHIFGPFLHALSGWSGAKFGGAGKIITESSVVSMVSGRIDTALLVLGARAAAYIKKAMIWTWKTAGKIWRSEIVGGFFEECIKEPIIQHLLLSFLPEDLQEFVVELFDINGGGTFSHNLSMQKARQHTADAIPKLQARITAETDPVKRFELSAALEALQRADTSDSDAQFQHHADVALEVLGSSVGALNINSINELTGIRNTAHSLAKECRDATVSNDAFNNSRFKNENREVVSEAGRLLDMNPFATLSSGGDYSGIFAVAAYSVANSAAAGMTFDIPQVESNAKPEELMRHYGWDTVTTARLLAAGSPTASSLITNLLLSADALASQTPNGRILDLNVLKSCAMAAFIDTGAIDREFLKDLGVSERRLDVYDAMDTQGKGAFRQEVARHSNSIDHDADDLAFIAVGCQIRASPADYNKIESVAIASGISAGQAKIFIDAVKFYASRGTSGEAAVRAMAKFMIEKAGMFEIDTIGQYTQVLMACGIILSQQIPAFSAQLAEMGIRISAGSGFAVKMQNDAQLAREVADYAFSTFVANRENKMSVSDAVHRAALVNMDATNMYEVSDLVHACYGENSALTRRIILVFICLNATPVGRQILGTFNVQARESGSLFMAQSTGKFLKGIEIIALGCQPDNIDALVAAEHVYAKDAQKYKALKDRDPGRAQTMMEGWKLKVQRDRAVMVGASVAFIMNALNGIPAKELTKNKIDVFRSMLGMTVTISRGRTVSADEARAFKVQADTALNHVMSDTSATEETRRAAREVKTLAENVVKLAGNLESVMRRGDAKEILKVVKDLNAEMAKMTAGVQAGGSYAATGMAGLLALNAILVNVSYSTRVAAESGLQEGAIAEIATAVNAGIKVTAAQAASSLADYRNFALIVSMKSASLLLMEGMLGALNPQVASMSESLANDIENCNESVRNLIAETGKEREHFQTIGAILTDNAKAFMVIVNVCRQNGSIKTMVDRAGNSVIALLAHLRSNFDGVFGSLSTITELAAASSALTDINTAFEAVLACGMADSQGNRTIALGLISSVRRIAQAWNTIMTNTSTSVSAADFKIAMTVFANICRTVSLTRHDGKAAAEAIMRELTGMIRGQAVTARAGLLAGAALANEKSGIFTSICSLITAFNEAAVLCGIGATEISDVNVKLGRAVLVAVNGAFGMSSLAESAILSMDGRNVSNHIAAVLMGIAGQHEFNTLEARGKAKILISGLQAIRQLNNNDEIAVSEVLNQNPGLARLMVPVAQELMDAARAEISIGNFARAAADISIIRTLAGNGSAVTVMLNYARTIGGVEGLAALGSELSIYKETSDDAAIFISNVVIRDASLTQSQVEMLAALAGGTSSSRGMLDMGISSDIVSRLRIQGIDSRTPSFKDDAEAKAWFDTHKREIAERLSGMLSNPESFTKEKFPVLQRALSIFRSVDGKPILLDFVAVDKEISAAEAKVLRVQQRLLGTVAGLQSRIISSGRISDPSQEVIFNSNISRYAAITKSLTFLSVMGGLGRGKFLGIRLDGATGMLRKSFNMIPFVGGYSNVEIFSMLLTGSGGNAIQMLSQGAARRIISERRARKLIERLEGRTVEELVAEGRMPRVGAEKLMGRKVDRLIETCQKLEALADAIRKGNIEDAEGLANELKGLLPVSMLPWKNSTIRFVKEYGYLTKSLFGKQDEINTDLRVRHAESDNLAEKAFLYQAMVMMSKMNRGEMTAAELRQALQDLRVGHAQSAPAETIRDICRNIESMASTKEKIEAMNGLARNRLIDAAKKIRKSLIERDNSFMNGFKGSFRKILEEREIGEFITNLRVDPIARQGFATALLGWVKDAEGLLARAPAFKAVLDAHAADRDSQGNIIRYDFNERNISAIIDALSSLSNEELTKMMIATGAKTSLETESMWFAAEQFVGTIAEHPEWITMIADAISGTIANEVILNDIAKGGERGKIALRQFMMNIVDGLALGTLQIATLNTLTGSITRRAINAIVFQNAVLNTLDPVLRDQVVDALTNINTGYERAMQIIENSSLDAKTKEEAKDAIKSLENIVGVLETGPGCAFQSLVQSVNNMSNFSARMMEAQSRKQFRDFLLTDFAEAFIGKDGIYTDIQRRSNLSIELTTGRKEINVLSIEDIWDGKEPGIGAASIAISLKDISATEEGGKAIRDALKEMTEEFKKPAQLRNDITYLKYVLAQTENGHDRKKIENRIRKLEGELSALKDQDMSTPENMMAAVAMINLMAKGYLPYAEQVAATQLLTATDKKNVSMRNVIELLTGEGKTTVGMMTCYIKTMKGSGVLYVDTAGVLSDKNYREALQVLSPYGISIGHVTQHMKESEKREQYKKDIVFLSIDTLAFDVNNDKDIAEVESGRRLIRADLEDLKKISCVVDELDSILIDQALTSFIQVRATATISAEKMMEIIAADMAAETQTVREFESVRDEGFEKTNGTNFDDGNLGTLYRDNKHVMIDSDKRDKALGALLEVLSGSRKAEFVNRVKAALERSGMQRDPDVIEKMITGLKAKVVSEKAGIGSKSNEEINEMIKNGCYLALMQDALTAQRAHQCGTDYTVVAGQIMLTQEMTGTNSVGQRLKGGAFASLHQFLEAKEKLIIRGEGNSSSEITAKQLFVDIFSDTVGMTGTLGRGDESDLLHDLYGFNRQKVPPHNFKQRKDRPKEVFLNSAEMIDRVIDDVVDAIANDRPVLLNVESVKQADELFRMISAREGEINQKLLALTGDPSKTFSAATHLQTFTAREESTKNSIKSKAAIPGMVTIATAISGRGVDIELTEMAKGSGLLVIALCLHNSQRVEMQLRGRSGRKGQQGDTKIYVTLAEGSKARKMLDEARTRFGERSKDGSIAKMAMDAFDEIFNSSEYKRVQELEIKRNSAQAWLTYTDSQGYSDKATELRTELENIDADLYAARQDLNAMRRAHSGLFDKALDIAQKAKEEKFAEQIKGNVRDSSLKYRLLESIRKVQSAKTAELLGKLKDTEPTKDILTGIDEILGVPDISGFEITKQLQEKFGLLYDEDSIGALLNTASGVLSLNSSEFRQRLIRSVTDMLARRCIDSQIESIREDFYKKTENMMRFGNMSKKTIIKAAEAEARNAMGVIRNVAVTAQGFEKYVQEQIGIAKDTAIKIEYYENAKSEAYTKLQAARGAGDRTVELEQLERIAECYQELKTLDPSNVDYYDSQIRYFSQSISVLRKELGRSDSGVETISPIVKPSGKKKTGLLTEIREEVLGPQRAYVARTVSSQARRISAQEVAEMMARAEGNAAVMSEAVDLQDGSAAEFGLDGTMVLRCREEQIAASLLKAKKDGKLGKPIVCLPPDDDPAITSARCQKIREELSQMSQETLSGLGSSRVVLIGFSQSEPGTAAASGKLFVMHLGYSQTDPENEFNRALMGLADAEDSSGAGITRLIKESAGKEKGVVEIDGYKFGFADTDDGIRVIRGNITEDEELVLGQSNKNVAGFVKSVGLHIDINGKITLGDRQEGLLSASDFINEMKVKGFIKGVPAYRDYSKGFSGFLSRILDAIGSMRKKIVDNITGADKKHRETVKDFIYTWRGLPQAFDRKALVAERESLRSQANKLTGDAKNKKNERIAAIDDILVRAEEVRGLMRDLRGKDEAKRTAAAAKLVEMAKKLGDPQLDALLAEFGDEIIKGLKPVADGKVSMPAGTALRTEEINFVLAEAFAVKGEAGLRRGLTYYNRAASSAAMNGNKKVEGDARVERAKIYSQGNPVKRIIDMAAGYKAGKIAIGVVKFGIPIVIGLVVSVCVFHLPIGWALAFAVPGVIMKAFKLLQGSQKDAIQKAIARGDYKAVQKYQKMESVKNTFAKWTGFSFVKTLINGLISIPQTRAAEKEAIKAAMLGNEEAIVLMFDKPRDLKTRAANAMKSLTGAHAAEKNALFGAMTTGDAKALEAIANDSTRSAAVRAFAYRRLAAGFGEKRTALVKEREAAEARRRDLEARRNKLNEEAGTDKKLGAIDNEINDLIEEGASISNQLDNLDKAKANAEKVIKEIEDAARAALDKEIEQLRAEKEQFDSVKAREDAEIKFAEAQNERPALERRMGEITKRVFALQAKVSEVSAERDKVSKELDGVEKGLRAISDQQNKLAAQAKEMQGMEEYYSGKALEAEGKYNEAIERYNDCLKKLSEDRKRDRMAAMLGIVSCHEKAKDFSKAHLTRGRALALGVVIEFVSIPDLANIDKTIAEAGSAYDKTVAMRRKIGLLKSMIEDPVNAARKELLQSALYGTYATLIEVIKGKGNEAAEDRTIAEMKNRQSEKKRELAKESAKQKDYRDWWMSVADDDKLRADAEFAESEWRKGIKKLEEEITGLEAELKKLETEAAKRMNRNTKEIREAELEQESLLNSIVLKELRAAVIADSQNIEARLELADTYSKARNVKEAARQYLAVLARGEKAGEENLKKAYDGLVNLLENNVLEQAMAEELVKALFKDDSIVIRENAQGNLVIKALKKMAIKGVDIDGLISAESDKRKNALPADADESDLETMRKQSILDEMTASLTGKDESFEAKFAAAMAGKDDISKMNALVELINKYGFDTAEGIIALNGLLGVVESVAMTAAPTRGPPDIIKEMIRLLIPTTTDHAMREAQDAIRNLKHRGAVVDLLNNILIRESKFIGEKDNLTRIFAIIDANDRLTLEEAVSLKIDLLKKEYVLRPSVEIYIQIADLYNDIGQSDKAIKYLEKALAYDKNSKEACLELAKIYLAKGDIQKAQDMAMKALELDAKFVDAHLIIGRIRMNEARYRDALGSYKTALEADPKNKEAQDAIDNIYILSGEGKPDVDFYLTLGDRYIEEGQFEAARECFLKVLENKPQIGDKARKERKSILRAYKEKEARAYYGLARTYEAIGVFDLAVINYDMAIKSGLETADVYRRLADSLQKQGNPGWRISRRIKSLYVKALKLEKDDAGTIESRAKALESSGKKESAVKEYMKAADIYKKAGKHDEAMRVHEIVLAIDPNNKEAIIGRIDACISKDDLETAEGLVKDKENLLKAFQEELAKQSGNAAPLLTEIRTMLATFIKSPMKTGTNDRLKDLKSKVEELVGKGILTADMVGRIQELQEMAEEITKSGVNLTSPYSLDLIREMKKLARSIRQEIADAAGVDITTSLEAAKEAFRDKGMLSIDEVFGLHMRLAQAYIAQGDITNAQRHIKAAEAINFDEKLEQDRAQDIKALSDKIKGIVDKRDNKRDAEKYARKADKLIKDAGKSIADETRLADVITDLVEVARLYEDALAMDGRINYAAMKAMEKIAALLEEALMKIAVIEAEMKVVNLTRLEVAESAKTLKGVITKIVDRALSIFAEANKIADAEKNRYLKKYAAVLYSIAKDMIDNLESLNKNLNVTIGEELNGKMSELRAYVDEAGLSKESPKSMIDGINEKALAAVKKPAPKVKDSAKIKNVEKEAANAGVGIEQVFESMTLKDRKGAAHPVTAKEAKRMKDLAYSLPEEIEGEVTPAKLYIAISENVNDATARNMLLGELAASSLFTVKVEGGISLKTVESTSSKYGVSTEYIFINLVFRDADGTAKQVSAEDANLLAKVFAKIQSVNPELLRFISIGKFYGFVTANITTALKIADNDKELGNALGISEEVVILTAIAHVEKVAQAEQARAEKLAKEEQARVEAERKTAEEAVVEAKKIAARAAASAKRKTTIAEKKRIKDEEEARKKAEERAIAEVAAEQARLDSLRRAAEEEAARMAEETAIAEQARLDALIQAAKETRQREEAERKVKVAEALGVVQAKLAKREAEEKAAGEAERQAEAQRATQARAKAEEKEEAKPAVELTPEEANQLFRALSRTPEEEKKMLRDVEEQARTIEMMLLRIPELVKSSQADARENFEKALDLLKRLINNVDKNFVLQDEITSKAEMIVHDLKVLASIQQQLVPAELKKPKFPSFEGMPTSTLSFNGAAGVVWFFRQTAYWFRVAIGKIQTAIAERKARRQAVRTKEAAVSVGKAQAPARTEEEIIDIMVKQGEGWTIESRAGEEKYNIIKMRVVAHELRVAWNNPLGQYVQAAIELEKSGNAPDAQRKLKEMRGNAKKFYENEDFLSLDFYAIADAIKDRIDSIKENPAAIELLKNERRMLSDAATELLRGINMEDTSIMPLRGVQPPLAMMSAAPPASMVGMTNIFKPIGRLPTKARNAIEAAYYGEERVDNEVVVRYSGIEYSGATLKEALKGLPKEVADAVRKEAKGAYEASYAILQGGRVSLSRIAAFDVAEDGTVRSVSCTEDVSSEDGVPVERGHLHLRPIKSMEELRGDMIAMMIRKESYGKYVDEHIWQITSDGIKESILKHENGNFVLYQDGRPYAPDGKTFALSANDVIGKMSIKQASEGLTRSTAWQVGAVIAMPSEKSGPFVNKVRETIGVKSEFIYIIRQILDAFERAPMKDRVPKDEIYGAIGRISMGDGSAFHNLALSLRTAGAFKGDCATFIDLRSVKGFNLNDMIQAVKNMARGAGAGSPLKIGIVVDTKVDPIKGVDIISDNTGRSAFDVVGEYARMKGIDTQNISIGVPENDENIAAAESYIRTNLKSASSILIANADGLNKAEDKAAIPALNIINLLGKLATAQELNVMTIGCSTENVGKFASLMQQLNGILRLIVIAKEDIGRRVKEFIGAMQATARSL